MACIYWVCYISKNSLIAYSFDLNARLLILRNQKFQVGTESETLKKKHASKSVETKQKLKCTFKSVFVLIFRIIIIKSYNDDKKKEEEEEMYGRRHDNSNKQKGKEKLSYHQGFYVNVKLFFVVVFGFCSCCFARCNERVISEHVKHLNCPLRALFHVWIVVLF